jgi:predicted TIM-barrel fold metal-dependent hydrolase
LSIIQRGTGDIVNFQGNRTADANAFFVINSNGNVGIGWTDPAVAREANTYIMESIARYPKRLAGLCSVNPCWGEAALAEVERCVQGGARGIGELHPDTQGIDLSNGGLLQPFMEMARSHSLLVVTHASEPVGHSYDGKGKVTPPVLLRFIQQFPEVSIVCAHWGGGLPFYALMPEVQKALRNTYFDSAASAFLYRPQVFSVAAQLLDPQRLLFGTDFPLLSQKRMLAQVQESGLGQKEKQMLLHDNAARLLGWR